MNQALGKFVTGEDFHGRDTELAEFIGRIEAGAHQLLIAQRRMGKTSMLKEAALRLSTDYECIYIDFESDQNAADAIARISLGARKFSQWQDKIGRLYDNVLAEIMGNIGELSVYDFAIKLRSGLTESNWESKGNHLFELLASSPKPVLLLFDEIPIVVNNMLKDQDYHITPERRSNTEKFLSWLREVSLKHQGKIRIVLTGSVGLEPILRQAGISATINNFYPFHLEPWSEETSIECIEKLAVRYAVDLHRDAPEKMVKLLGCCIPHHVQMFFDHILFYCRMKDDFHFPLEKVIDVYKNDMLSSRGHAELTHYEDRLKKVLGLELLPLATDMLSEAAITGHLTSEAMDVLRDDYPFEDFSPLEAQKEILMVLEHDGYLKPARKGHVFISKLLKDWWKGKNKSFYKPVSKRTTD